jgi:hypothetical protein
MRKNVMAAGAAAILIALASPASAQGMGPGGGMGMGRGPVTSACAPEIDRYCAGERHGSGAVRACLQSHRHRLSGNCRYALGHTSYRWR